MDKNYLTGVLWQDFQHTKLIDLLSKLSKADQNDATVFDYAVAFLAMYVNDHFDLEEAYMKAYHFPDTEEHVHAHKAFIKQVRDLRQTHKTHSPEAMALLITKITEWIKSHIMGADQTLGEFITAKETKKD